MDDFVAALEAFENEGAEYLSPREYAKLRGVVPQRVYYFIRQGKLKCEPCGSCGRRVVRVLDADLCFGTFARRPIEQGEGVLVVPELSEVEET